MTNYYIVSAGVDSSHKDFHCETFGLLRNAVAHYNSLVDNSDESCAYCEIRNEESILVRQNINGDDMHKYTIEMAGYTFGSHKRTDLLKQVKNWFNENEEKLLEYFDIIYFGNIERTDSIELTSTLHVLNGMIKKSLRANIETINNYKPR
tara:strand:- start:17093 stop:17542 length:450 start_codon:yes stop_codon:yes gene_type:complete